MVHPSTGLSKISRNERKNSSRFPDYRPKLCGLPLCHVTLADSGGRRAENTRNGMRAHFLIISPDDPGSFITNAQNSNGGGGGGGRRRRKETKRFEPPAVRRPAQHRKPP